MALEEEAALALLTTGELEMEGLLVDASNATVRGWVSADGLSARCVYKPVRGERPLWDFPHGTLAGREVAAYQVSRASGWDLVPPTVLRDGPLGTGACQLWIDAEDFTSLVTLAETLPDGWHRVATGRAGRGRRSGTPVVLGHADDPRLARLAVLDAVLNNADRKGGHLLPTGDGRLYAVDHGVCFHTEDKLRTVLWGWAEDPLADEHREVLERLRAELSGTLGPVLAGHLTAAEVRAAVARIDRLLGAACFPLPSDDWPAIPWPPL